MGRKVCRPAPKRCSTSSGANRLDRQITINISNKNLQASRRDGFFGQELVVVLKKLQGSTIGYGDIA